MSKNYEPLDSETLLLDQYLYQYKCCINRKRTLERRRNEIIREFDNPIKGMSYDGMPHGIGEGLGCAELSLRLDEINTKIKEQTNRSVKVLAEIMDIIDLIPENTIERSIIEKRYIDRLRWWQICRDENISRTPATDHWKEGLKYLLKFKKVQKILIDYGNSIDEI